MADFTDKGDASRPTPPPLPWSAPPATSDSGSNLERDSGKIGFIYSDSSRLIVSFNPPHLGKPMYYELPAGAQSTELVSTAIRETWTVEVFYQRPTSNTAVAEYIYIYNT